MSNSAERPRGFTKEDDEVILHFVRPHIERLNRNSIRVNWRRIEYDVKRAIFPSGQTYYHDPLMARTRKLIKETYRPKKRSPPVINLPEDDEDDRENSRDRSRQVSSLVARIKKNEDESNNGVDDFQVNLSDPECDLDPLSSSKNNNNENCRHENTNSNFKRELRGEKTEEETSTPSKKIKTEESCQNNTEPKIILQQFLKKPGKARRYKKLNRNEKELATLLASYKKDRPVWDHIKCQASGSLRKFIAKKEKGPLFEFNREMVRTNCLHLFENMKKDLKEYLNTNGAQYREKTETDENLKLLEEATEDFLQEFCTFGDNISRETDTIMNYNIKKGTSDRKQLIQLLKNSFFP